MATKGSTTLHELVTESFCRTPNGLIFTHDIKTVYSVFLICLSLKDDSKKPKKWLQGFQRGIDKYTFSVREAVETMKNLELEVDVGATCINISYKIHPKLAHHLLETFMTAKLLHTPADRTRGKPKEKVLLQPTPKGVSILHRYTKDIGLKAKPDILLSEFNSMEIFLFERNSLTDSIVHSDNLVRLLFTKMMGLYPNVWSPDNPNDKIPALSKLLDYSDESFSFSTVQRKPHKPASASEKERTAGIDQKRHQASCNSLNDEYRVSPFVHKFFTNPDSDSHIQYYASDGGLRLFKSKIFGHKKTLIDYCFTTKALWQWIMDCTDVIYPKEAVSVAALFLKGGLIVPILLPPSENSIKRFHISRLSYYTLSQRGWNTVRWNTELGIKNYIHSAYKVHSSISSVAINDKKPDDCLLHFKSDDLGPGFDGQESFFDVQFKNVDDILADPGMRYLFRRHLEKEFCTENLDAFIEIEKFFKKLNLLRQAINSKGFDNSVRTNVDNTPKNQIKCTMEAVLVRHANEILELAYHICSSYVMINSPNELNIDHALKESISKILMNPNMNRARNFLSETISENCDYEPQENTLSTGENPLAMPTKVAIKANSREISFLTKTTSSCKQICDTNESSQNFLKFEHQNLIPTLNMLSNLHPMFEALMKEVHRLMNVDSFQKFVTSNVCQEAFVLFSGIKDFHQEQESESLLPF